MAIFARAVITGFGMSLGAALFKKLSKRLGLEESEAPPAEAVEAAAGEDGETEPAR